MHNSTSKIIALIFDFDGVIVESNDEKTKAFADLFARYPEHSQAMLAYHYAHQSKPRMEKFEHCAVELLHLSEPEKSIELTKMADTFSSLVIQKVIDCPEVPGAKSFLKKYSTVFPLFLASNTPVEELRKILDAREGGPIY